MLYGDLSILLEAHIFLIDEPSDFATISSSTIKIQGKAERVKNLILNGRSISVDELGNFKEDLVVFPGLNIVTLEAHDQFGREINKQIRLYGNEQKI
jgi:hypothetical protein